MPKHPKQPKHSRSRSGPSRSNENSQIQVKVEGADAQFCTVCKARRVHEIYNKPYAPTKDSASKLMYEVFPYGTVKDIKDRTTCDFCKLISRLLPIDTSQNTEIEVRSIFYPYSRTPQFLVWTKIVFHGCRRFFGSIRFHGKGDQTPATGPQRDCSIASPDLIKTWIQYCEQHHDHSLTNTFSRGSFPIDILLIDVLQNRLMKITSGSRYFALSYVWGEVKMPHTTSSNRRQLERPNGLQYIQVPPVIRDSMELVRRLGERYLWVDALCIEQDNPSQKHSQISQMDIVYSQAIATIVALSGLDAESPLPGIRNGTRLYPKIAGTINDVAWELSPPRFSQALLNSEYETRAWTYQERMLSRKCLFFTNHCVWFHCRLRQCNDVDDILHMDVNTDSMAVDGYGGEFNTLSILTELSDEHDWADVMDLYGSMVAEYTRRKLRVASDTLNALSGILALYRHLIGGDTPEGLLERYLDLSLLWISPRESGLGVDPTRNPHFSSWSWAGWTGVSSYKGGPIYPWMNDEPRNTPLSVTSEIKNVEYSLRAPRRQLLRILPESGETPQPSPLDANSTSQVRRVKGILHFETEAVQMHHFHPRAFKSIDWRIRESPRSPQILICNKVVQILDRTGHHCGTVLGYFDERIKNCDPKFCDYILLSRSPYPAVYDQSSGVWKPDPCAEAVFDHQAYLHSNTCILNVMLIVWIGDLAERIALCQIHEDAWRKAGPRRKKITLG